MEKRSNPRRRINASIVCSRFKSLQEGETIEGNMKNCCSAGFCAELNAQVKPGVILVVRSSGRSWGHFADDGSRSLALAEGRWSKATSVETDACYATGLKYLMAY